MRRVPSVRYNFGMNHLLSIAIILCCVIVGFQPAVLLSARLSHDRRVQILRKELNVAPHAIHLMTRLSKAVVLARIDHELDRHLAFDQRLVKLLRLGDRHARIDLAVHDHRRRLYVVDVLHRRAIIVKLLRVPRRFVGVEPVKIAMNVRL